MVLTERQEKLQDENDVGLSKWLVEIWEMLVTLIQILPSANYQYGDGDRQCTDQGTSITIANPIKHHNNRIG